MDESLPISRKSKLFSKFDLAKTFLILNFGPQSMEWNY